MLPVPDFLSFHSFHVFDIEIYILSTFQDIFLITLVACSERIFFFLNLESKRSDQPQNLYFKTAWLWRDCKMNSEAFLPWGESLIQQLLRELNEMAWGLGNVMKYFSGCCLSWFLSLSLSTGHFGNPFSKPENNWALFPLRQLCLGQTSAALSQAIPNLLVRLLATSVLSCWC